MVHLNPLCNTQSHWLHNAPFQTPSTTALPSKADIVIVGGNGRYMHGVERLGS